jgi:hypothetical protein
VNDDDYQREMDKLEARDKADVAEAVQLLRDIRDAVRELKPAAVERENGNGDRNGVYALAILGHLDDLVEAVRALKPAPMRKIIMTAAGPLEVSATSDVETRLLDEVERLRGENERHQELNKHGIGIAGNGVLYGPGVACKMVGEWYTELKFFREREEKLTELFAMLDGVHMRLPGDVNAAWAAVRDFEVGADE